MGEEFYAVLKLITGEEIFSLVSVDENDGDSIIMLSNPVIMKMIQGPVGSYVKVLQGRSFLQFPVKERGEIDLPHIDICNKIHIVGLYYVMDSDGDTVIYNERKESETYTIKERVSPKQGRMVIFDGGLFHAAEQPLNNTRCIINYNIE